MGLALPSWPDACSVVQERETIVQLEDPNGDRLVTVSDTLCCADGGVAILTARVKGARAPSPKRAKWGQATGAVPEVYWLNAANPTQLPLHNFRTRLEQPLQKLGGGDVENML